MGLINQVCANMHAHACTYLHTHARLLSSVSLDPLRDLERFVYDCCVHQVYKLLTNVLMIRETRSFPFFIYLNENVHHPRIMTHTPEASLIPGMHKGHRID